MEIETINAPPPDNSNGASLLHNRVLGNIILQAIHSIPLGQLLPVAAPSAGVAFQPRSLLAVVSYCYAMGILGSQDIEHALEGDQLFRLLCDNEFPNWHVIRRFRRLNRVLLHQSLEQICLAGGAQVLTFKPLPQVAAATPSRLAPSPSNVSAEVDKLIEQAVLLDTVALDH